MQTVAFTTKGPDDDFFANLEEPLRSQVDHQVKGVARISIVNGGDDKPFTCPKCGGHGSRTYGYVNIRSYPCHTCHSTGKVTHKRIAAVASAAKGRETADRNDAQRRVEFFETHKAEIEFLRRNSEWSEFYRSLYSQASDRGSLSDGQIASIRKGMAKAAEKATERNAAAPTVDVAAIEALFDATKARAQAKGLKAKKLAFRALDGIEVSLAPTPGRNAGSLYVRENGEYAGKITAGRFLATSQASAAVLPRLLLIASDPGGQAVLFGKECGICCCCGRDLTDPVSIANGIGPICADGWGF